MLSQLSVSGVTVCVLCALVTVTGCAATSKSPMAQQVSVCGKAYQPKPSVVVVREEPQWLAVDDLDCAGSMLVSPLPKSTGAGTADLSKAMNVAALHLRGMPRFEPTVSTGSAGMKGGVSGRGSDSGFPVLPLLSTSTSGVRRTVPSGSGAVSRVACVAGQSLLETDVYFPRGGHEVSERERTKLAQLRGRPISYVFIEGLTEVPGLTSAMVPLAKARAQAVQRVVQESVVSGVSVNQSLRAGCCTKQGEPGSAGHDDLGVAVSACMGTETDVKKGEASSMAK